MKSNVLPRELAAMPKVSVADPVADASFTAAAKALVREGRDRVPGPFCVACPERRRCPVGFLN